MRIPRPLLIAIFLFNCAPTDPPAADGVPHDVRSDAYDDVLPDAADDVGPDVPTDVVDAPDATTDTPDGNPLDTTDDTSDTDDFDYAPARAPLGGEATVTPADGETFSTLLDHLPLEAFSAASRGRELFVGVWEPGAGGRELLNGLGPHFHVAACQACHPPGGRPPTYDASGAVLEGVLFRAARVGDDGAYLGPDPVYGAQIQPRALVGVPVEATLRWLDNGAVPADVPRVQVGDHTVVFEQLGYGPLHEDTQLGARLSPHLAGMGLLDHIPAEQILAWEDPNDEDADGISGRAHWHGEGEDRRIGRYGWKANMPDLRTQIAGAFRGDMGITSPVFPADDCTDAQAACVASPNGGAPEVTVEALDAVVAYMQLLGVPRRQAPPGTHDDGYRAFVQVGCAGCHRPTFTTAPHASVAVMSEQTIYPFTDLLLHDMGPALSDGIPDGDASAAEWRTPPLWGIGRVASHSTARFMHDGRAGSIAQAIAAHGGEGAASARAFADSNEETRRALLDFVTSL